MNDPTNLTEPTCASSVLLKAVNPEVRALFDYVMTAKTAAQWVHRSSLLATEIAIQLTPTPESLTPGLAPWPFATESYCPACNQGLAGSGSRRHRAAQHLDQSGRNCPVVRELLRLLDFYMEERFSPEQVHEARRDQSLAAERARVRRRQSAGIKPF